MYWYGFTTMQNSGKWKYRPTHLSWVIPFLCELFLGFCKEFFDWKEIQKHVYTQEQVVLSYDTQKCTPDEVNTQLTLNKPDIFSHSFLRCMTIFH